MAKAVKAVGNAISGVVKGVVNVVKSVVKAVVNVVASVVSMVVQPFMGLMGGMPSIGDAQEADRQQGVLVQQQGGGAQAVPVVYGFRKLAGITTFAETGSTNNKYLWVVYTFCEGPVNGLRELYLNDEALPSTMIASLNAGTQVDITEGKFKGRVSMQWSPGVYFATPSSSTLGTTLKNGLFKDAPSFTSTMVHNGLACLFVRYEWLEIKTQADADANPFSGSIPTMQVVMQGRRIASLETSTSESYEYEASGYTERYSTNPAEILLDYLRNPRYGKGLKNSEIDWDSWRIAAAKCNTTVTYTSTNIQGPILTCNYVLDTSYSIFQNVKLLLQGFRAYMPYVQGKYKLKIEDAGHPTLINSGAATIVAECTSDYQVRSSQANEGLNYYDIMGDVTYTGIERSAKYNAVVVTYVEPSAKWATNQVVYPATEAERQTYITIDGGRENKLEVTFSTITNQAIAWDFARLLFNKSRNQETCTVKVSSSAFELEPGDCIRIQSQILNFADTPWRVINIAYNDDYTFDLSCVRNPDSLYPYTRVGEPDIVLPIYIPKGATIYYPVERDPLPIGLVPPTTIPFTGGGTTLNPAPNNPTSTPDAGGVGGTGSTINTSTPNNNTPPGAVKPVPLDDVIDITNVEYITKNGLIYARLTAKQPSHSMYAGVNIYFALNGNKLGYNSIEDRQKPGAGAVFYLEVGPLAVVSSLQATFNQYQAYFRVVYSTGEYSTKFFATTFNPATNENAGTNPTELVQIAANSWPNLIIAQAGARDNKVDIIRFVVPSPQTNPRTGSFQFSQDVRTQVSNPDVTGMNIYAKSDAETYWTKTSYTFSSYSPGTEYSIPYTGFLGTIDYGVSGSVGSKVPVAGGGAIYTFVFRFTYKDGSESTNQYVKTGKVRTDQYSASATGVDIFSGVGIATDTAVPTTGHMNVNAITVTEAPAGAVANALNTQTKMNATVAWSSGGTIAFGLLAPDAANRSTWQGMRFRYRAISTGTPPFVTANFYDTTIDAGIYTPFYPITDMKHDTYYEVVATPLVVSSGNFKESNYSSYGIGYVSRSTVDPYYPGTTIAGYPNWAPLWKWTQMDTGVATSTLNKTFDAGTPVATVNKCVARLNDFDYTGLNLSPKIVKLRHWIELTYDCSTITGFTKLQVYRRSFSKTYDTTFAKHYGIGRWELIEFTASSGTVSLRFPTSWEEFDSKYGVAGVTTSPTLTKGYLSSNGYPAGAAGDNATNGESRFLIPVTTSLAEVQLLLRVVTSTGTSSKAVLIKGQANSSSLYTFDMLSPKTSQIVFDWNSATDPTAVNIRDADFTAGYKRTLGEARAHNNNVSVNDMFYRDPSVSSGVGYNKTGASANISTTLPGTGTV
jgi:hypothetical protein